MLGLLGSESLLENSFNITDPQIFSPRKSSSFAEKSGFKQYGAITGAVIQTRLSL